jgi:hypothetical protein
MKTRRAAALALVGWYLVQPPRGGKYGDQYYPNNPFPGPGPTSTGPSTPWTNFGDKEYATKEECEADRQAFKSAFGDPAVIPKERITARLMAAAVAALLCIASDDPRLKEK